jgi:low affinity Fe/Cu permease
MHDAFNRAAERANTELGSVRALVVVVVWAVTGPLFMFSDTWQLAIDTGSTW